MRGDINSGKYHHLPIQKEGSDGWNGGAAEEWKMRSTNKRGEERARKNDYETVY